jgi:enterobactin synthetase component D
VTARALFERFVVYEQVRFPPQGEPALDPVALPAEVARSVPKRRIEFAAGRHCAARALARLGLAGEPAALPIGPGGAPAWPDGVVGSITHVCGFAAAAVARGDRAVGLGLDTEVLVAEGTAREIASMVATPAELERVRLAGLDGATALTLAFSAKESLFKCVYRLVGRVFDFLDAAVVDASLPDGSLVLALRVNLGLFPAGTRLAARFAIADGLVHTGVTLAAS